MIMTTTNHRGHLSPRPSVQELWMRYSLEALGGCIRLREVVDRFPQVRGRLKRHI